MGRSAIVLVVGALAACVGGDPSTSLGEDGGLRDATGNGERDADTKDVTADDAPSNDAGSDAGADAGDGAPPKTGDVLWAVRFGGVGDDVWSRLAIAPNGDIIYTFAFTEQVTIGTSTTYPANAKSDILVVGLDSKNGAPKWSKRLVGSNDEAVRAIAVDPSGNIYLSQRVVTPDPSTNCAVSRLDSSGNHEWTVYGTSAGCGAETLAADANAVYAPFYFQGGMNPGQSMTSAGDFDGVLVRFNGDTGSVPWVRQFGATGRDLATGIALSGDLFVAATFSSTVTFPNGGSAMAATGGSDLALARYDTAGNHVFSRRFGGGGDERSTGIASDGNVIAVAGTCTGTTNLGGSDLTCGAPRGPFVALYDAKSTPGGAHLFSRALAATGYAQSVSVTQGDAIFSGFINAPVDFGAGMVDGIGGTDSFVVRYDAKGAVVWAKIFGGTDDDIAASHATAPDGRTFVTGDFRGSATFGTKTLTSAGRIDSYVIALAP